MSKIPLNRESILRGDIRKFAEGQEHSMRLMSDAEREDWVQRVFEVIPRHCTHQNLWVFGYGSLIWNPAFHFEEKRTARVSGYHRRFCLWTHLGRGTQLNPGLMLGLDRGGSCTGVGFQIAKKHVRSEENGDKHHGITFVMDKQHERFTGKLDIATQVRHIATAEGPLGPNKEYLFDLVDHLDDLGLRDRALSQLATLVREYTA